MQADFWKERWQRNEIGFHQEDFNPLLQKYWPGLGVAPGARVFVPLCGKSRDMLWLAAQGHPVLGIEIVELAVRAFFDENGMTPTIVEQRPFQRYQAGDIALLLGDFYSLAPADLAGVGGVYDRAALIALPPSQRGAYVAKLAEVLPARVEMLLLSVTYPQEQMQGPPFSVPEGEVRELYEEHFTVERLMQRDALARNPRFRARGLRSMSAEAYHIRR